MSEATQDVIAVYGSKNSDKEAYARVYRDIKFVMDRMDAEIKKALLASQAKMLVVSGEDEVENDNYFFSLLPVEAIFTADGDDESLPSANYGGLTATKLELMYLCVYYALLTDTDLAAKYDELKAAYEQAAIDSNYFTPAPAYQDGYEDDIHENASDNNALKYGSYLFNAYMLYFGNGQQPAGEFSITSKKDLEEKNPLGFEFVQKYFDQPVLN